jgi:hypothetical protein
MKMIETQVSARREMETALIEKCWKDPEFKKAVVSDPKGMLERHTGRSLPPGMKIFIHEEDANTLHLTIPPAPGNLGELSDDDLEKVAGGTEFFIAMGVVSVAAAAASAMGSVAGVTKTSGGW